MTPEQISLVQASFESVKPIRKTAGALFYTNLFEASPELRPLFKGDIEEQGNKLIETLGVAVSLLRHPEKLTTAIRDLGYRHAQYGANEAHFAPVGQALIKTLQQALGPRFNDELQTAWVEVYRVASSVMSEGLADGLADAKKRQALKNAASAPTVVQNAVVTQRKPWWKRLFGM